MSAIILTLGGIAFRDFEVPEHIVFGGSQILATHQIIGGPRLVDALGATEGEILLAGVFSGPDATIRVQALDVARSVGGTLPLIWQGFFYSVVIAELTATYTKPWWIPFRLKLVVVQDIIAALPSLLEQATLDLATVSQVYAPQGGLIIENTQIPSLTNVNIGLDAVGVKLSDTQSVFSDNVSILNNAHDAKTAVVSINNLVNDSGTMAGLAGTQAYLGRAAASLNGVFG